MIKKYCDLHTHSIFSDGTYTPQQIIDAALENELAAVALCDHNTTAGLESFIKYAENKKIKAVAGAEISTAYKDKELHIVALCLNPKTFEKIETFVDGARKEKEKSNRSLIAALVKAGFFLDYEALKANTPNGNVNRAVIAKAMVKRGYVQSVAEAFETYLSKEGGLYKEPRRPDVFSAILLIRSLGAAPVLAHPFLDLKEEELKIFLPKAKKAGLLAMEVEYSLFDEAACKLAKKLADEHGLLYSGGSDFHGQIKPDIQIGFGKGNLRIPYEYLTAIEKAVENG